MDNHLYINREISWLSFNERVLQESCDPTVPLLERLRFLGIFSSNLDEFYRVRIANVQREIDYVTEKGIKLTKYGYDPGELMLEIQKAIRKMRLRYEQTFETLKRELSDGGVHILNETQLTAEQGALVRNYFKEQVLRKLVPIMIPSGGNAFPLLHDNFIYLAVGLRKSKSKKPARVALIEIPSKVLPRFYVLPKQGRHAYVMLLDDVIRYNLDEVFSILDYDTYSAHVIKISRDAELDFDDDLSQSFSQRVSKSLKERKIGRPVRLTYDKNIPADVLDLVMKGLGLTDERFLLPGSRYHNFRDFMNFPILGRKSYSYPRFSPLPHPAAPAIKRLFTVLKEGDMLLHYPYHTFDYNIELLREAAIDPYVTEIKITLYRVAPQSSLINALVNAQRNGKSVTAVIEFQARFDEEANIELANRLSDEGIRVIQGVSGLKVHTKVILIKRPRKRDTERYGVISTGNFHERTAHLYSDTALFTSNRKLLKEVEQLFDFFDYNYRSHHYNHLLVAPFNMRTELEHLIDQEIESAHLGDEAYLMVKVNSLVDDSMIAKLYEASQAGVRIRMIVRGICRLIPGVPGLSDNIEVRSIVDKYLEHSRIWIFSHGGQPKYYIASADWMERNLDRRVELAVPIIDKKLQAELRDLFEIQWADNCKARLINKEMSNTYVRSAQADHRSQIALEAYFAKKLNP
jgi:polyphosphate kinase